MWFLFSEVNSSAVKNDTAKNLDTAQFQLEAKSFITSIYFYLFFVSILKHSLNRINKKASTQIRTLKNGKIIAKPS